MASLMIMQGFDLQHFGYRRNSRSPPSPPDARLVQGLLACERPVRRPVACALFGSAAWKCADRDAFIGWERTTRERNLQHLTNNTRFLIPRWVRDPHLASHVLGLNARRIRSNWQEKYGHPVHALKTFAERSRFQGTCYRSVNCKRCTEHPVVF